jgi:hypothetical protein
MTSDLDDNRERIQYAWMLVTQIQPCAVELIHQSYSTLELKAHVDGYCHINKVDLEQAKENNRIRERSKPGSTKRRVSGTSSQDSSRVEKSASSVITTMSSVTSGSKTSPELIALVDSDTSARPAHIVGGCVGYNFLRAALLEDSSLSVDIEQCEPINVHFKLLNRQASNCTLKASEQVSLFWRSRGGTKMHGLTRFLVVEDLPEGDVVLGDHGPEGALRNDSNCKMFGR